MWLYVIAISLAIIFSSLVYWVGVIIMKKSKSSLSPSLPFECGISISLQSCKPVSLRFFLLSVVFLIFDVELLILYPGLIELIKMNSVKPLTVLSSFLIIITWGLLWEWSRQMLEWNK